MFSFFVQVETFNDPDLGQKIAEANLTFPVLVKPQVACGVADAHNMVIHYLRSFILLYVRKNSIIHSYFLCFFFNFLNV